ncbi:MAG: thiamine phosphate synthase [Terricaulis sp.]
MHEARVLTAIARRLNRDAGAPNLPALFFLTDPERTPDPEATISQLPPGAGVIYRHFGVANRRETARRLSALCRKRQLVFLIAADPELAASVAAHGVHWPERMLCAARVGRGLMTGAAHSAHAVARWHDAGADACVLSPIFATKSASGREPLGLFKASQIAYGSRIPVIALGGISSNNARTLIGRGFSSLAAVDALS